MGKRTQGSTGPGINSGTMSSVSLLLILLALLHSSLGSIVTTSHSLDMVDSVSKPTGRNNIATDHLTGTLSESDNGGDSGDSSGHIVEGTLEESTTVRITEIYPLVEGEQSRNAEMHVSMTSLLQKLTHDNEISEDTENANQEDHASSHTSNDVTSTITRSTFPAGNLPLLEMYDQEPDHHSTTIIETSENFNSTERLKQSIKHMILEMQTEDTQMSSEKQFKESHPPIVNDDVLIGKSTAGKKHVWTDPDTPVSPIPSLNTGSKATDEHDKNVGTPEHPELPIQHGVFESMSNHVPSTPGAPCLLGISPCVLPTNPNGTSLLWEDMRRTLAFAWELHVFGSAGLFVLLAIMAFLGVIGSWRLPHPHCDALAWANSLLLLAGALRAVLLFIDPYGTRQILSRPALSALHNTTLQLFLWAQIALALVTLRGVKLVLLPVKLQRPWPVGGLAVLHSSLLLLADLLSPTLSPAFPLLLQTLSLCWGLPFCMGIFIQSLSSLQSFLRTPIPEWGAPQRNANRALKVTAVCAFQGVLCCSLQMYSLLWLYGLLGNWRRFGWGWWLSQFWARILELAWGFSLLALGSLIYWIPRRGRSKSGHGQRKLNRSKGLDEASFRSRILANVRRGPFWKSEKTWEDLMPNNSASHRMSRKGMKNTVIRHYDEKSSSILSDHKPDAVMSNNVDSQAVMHWQRAGERECILSLIEFDMHPPSPINLGHSIDLALHHGHLGVGSLFTPPPPPWTHNMGANMAPPAHVGYRWALDTDSTPVSPDHFWVNESVQSPTAQILQHSPNNEDHGMQLDCENRSRISETKFQDDWSDDDITDL